MSIKYKQIISYLLIFLSANGWAEQSLVEQISSLRTDRVFINQIKDIKQSGLQQLQQNINRLVSAAYDDLALAIDEKSSVQKHVQALSDIQNNLNDYELFKDFILPGTNEYLLNDEDCIIADATSANFQNFDCQQSYQFAIKIWKRTLLAQRILLRWKKQARVNGLKRIQQGEQRWLDFSEQVTADQFPWETIVNGSFIEGSIATPPTYQLRLIHPVAVLSYVDETQKYNQELGLELLGYRKYNAQNYEPEWGLSVITLLESDAAENSGYGLIFSKKNFMFGIVQQDTAFNKDEIKYLFGYNLAYLFINKKNELAGRKLELLNKLDKYKQKIVELKSAL